MVYGEGVDKDYTTQIERTSRVPGIRRFLGARDTQLSIRGYEVLNERNIDYQRQFLDIPGIKENEVGMPTAPPSLTTSFGTKVKLSPMERAEYMRIIGETVVPWMAATAPMYAGYADSDYKKGKLNDAKRMAMDAARAKMWRYLYNVSSESQPLPEPAAPVIREPAVPVTRRSTVPAHILKEFNEQSELALAGR